jgi:REP element-mobilizing transposase RayT
LPLFETTNSYNLIYNWLKLIREKHEIETFAFVIMPNHVHLLLYIPDEKLNLNALISNGKRFMAYEIIKQLIRLNANGLLNILADGCTVKEKLKGQKHKVFEPSFDAKPIYSSEFWEQKLKYIHPNPVSGKWNLSADSVSYQHSSAEFYIDGLAHPDVEITNYYTKWDE